MSVATRPRTRFAAGYTRQAAIASLAFLAGVAASVALHRYQQATDRDQLAARIDTAVNTRVHALEASVRSYEDSLHGLRALVTFSLQLDSAEFGGAARELLRRHLGIVALEWAPLVPAADRERLEAWARRTISPDFRIWDRGSGPEVPTPAHHAEYLPIVYIEHRHAVPPLIGYNVLTGPAVAELEAARANGRPAMSRRIPRLQPEDQTEWGYVVYNCVYASIPEPGAVRPEEMRGALLAVFPLHRFFIDEPGTEGFELLVVDRTERSPDGVVALHHEAGTTETNNLPAPEAFLTPESRRVPFHIWGRDWELIYRPTSAWLRSAARRQPYTVLVLGIMVSGAFSLLLHHRLRYTAQIKRQVTERTAELRATQSALEEDVRRRTEAERALAASEERYRAFVAQSAEAIWRCEFDAPLPADAPIEAQIDHIYAHGYLAECNDAMARLFGQAGAAGLIGARLRDLHDPAEEKGRAFLRAFLTQGLRLQDVEAREPDREGRTRVFLTSLVGLRGADGRLVRMWGIRRDITAQRQAEAERAALERKLLEGQKLESLGVLAGGIAHDFNNLLTGILGNAGLVRHLLPAGSPLHANVREIESASLRAAELCKQMLAYSGKGRFIIEPVDLGDLVVSTVPLLRLSISKSARIHFELAEGLPPVMGDATQLRQILMNLVINASDAIGSQVGDITVSTGTVHAGRQLFQRAVLSPSVPEGAYVFLEVRDTGCGMKPETQARIFDPFFTTKFAGRGLGLAAVLGITRGHQGAMFVESAPGGGSTFRLLLPVADEPAPEPVLPASESRAPWHRDGRVLLVDDEEAVRFVGLHMLESFGLNVDAAPDGEAALARFDRPGAYDLVLLDLTMPGMDGEEVLQRLRAIDPTVRVLIMSGYSEQEVSRRVGPGNHAAFIQKPFTMETMRAKLQTLLEAGEGTERT